MDAFKVPKKVNRHVLKAINILSDERINNGAVSTSQILDQVKWQMKNLVPVPNIDMAIQKSLKNLSDIGLIERTGAQKFNVARSRINPPASNVNKPKPIRNLLNPSGSRKRSVSQLNPNLHRSRIESEESLSGNEHDRSRKRMRTNNKRLNYDGRSTELPKSKQHQFKTTTRRKFLKGTRSPVDMMSCCIDNSFDPNLGVALNNGFEPNFSTDTNLTKFSELLNFENSPEHISGDNSKVISFHQPSIADDLNVIELYNKSNSFSNDSVTNPTTNSSKSQTSEKGSAHSNTDIHKSETSVSLKPSTT